MKEARIKIIVLGPGRGHNLSLALNNLARNPKYMVNYFGAFYLNSQQFPSVTIYNYHSKWSILQWLYRIYLALIIPKCHVLYLLGDAVPYDFKLLSLLGKYKKIIYNIWSQNNIPAPNLISNFQAQLFKKSDAIQCNWYETANRLYEFYPEYSEKTIVFPWGMSYIMESISNTDEIQPFTSNLISRITKYKFRFINMRSIAPYNAIEEFLNATVLLKQTHPEIYSNCLFVFWPGNNVDENLQKYILQHIEINNLENNVWYLEHPFLPNKDITTLLNYFDFVVNLVKHDQFSTSIVEAMVLKKEVLCSKILPYENLNNRFGLNLPLTDLDPKSIAELIIHLVENKEREPHKEVLNFRKQWVLENLSSENYLRNLDNALKNLLQQ